MDRHRADVPDAYEPRVTVLHDPSPDETRTNMTILLALALGACDCWGLEPDCTVCHGEGSAGWSQPDGGVRSTSVPPSTRAQGVCGAGRRDNVRDQPDRDQEFKEYSEGEA